MISIVVPTFNRSHLLIETVKSILNQTYKDFELIVISDGSTDNTKKEILKIHDSRLKFIELEKNYGYPAKARNVGIKQSKGEYIALCDDDDIWNEDKLKQQVIFLEKGYSIVFTNHFLIGNLKKNFLRSIYNNFVLPIIINVFPKHISYYLLSVSNPIMNSSVIVSKKYFYKNKFIEDLKYRASEDYEMWIRLFIMSNPYYIKNELVGYRTHDFNISNNYLSNLERCLMIFKSLKSKNIYYLIFKIIGIINFTLRIKYTKWKQ